MSGHDRALARWHLPGVPVPRKSVNGTLVLADGDVNLTFKRYIRAPIALRIENDYVRAIEGDGMDADMMREYFAAWGDAGPTRCRTSAGA